MLEAVILGVLLTLMIPLGLFVFYQITTPVPGARWRRRIVSFKALKPVTRILIAQKIDLILIVGFIALVRFAGPFPAKEWVAFGLYASLVILAWTMFAYMRHLQLPREREIRRD